VRVVGPRLEVQGDVDAGGLELRRERLTGWAQGVVLADDDERRRETVDPPERVGGKPSTRPSAANA
jgi:hypothetical protein